MGKGFSIITLFHTLRSHTHFLFYIFILDYSYTRGISSMVYNGDLIVVTVFHKRPRQSLVFAWNEPG